MTHFQCVKFFRPKIRSCKFFDKFQVWEEGGGGVVGGGVGGFVNLLIVKKPLLSLFVLAVSDSDLNYRRFRYTSEQVGMGEEERE